MVHTLRLDNYYPTPRKLVLGTNSSYGTETIKIERGAGWDGLNLTATWHIPGREEPLRVALLDGDAMDVPPEVTKEAKDGVLVLAGLAPGVQRASCNVEYLILEQAGVYGGADAEPTPELAAQVLQAARNAEKNSAEAKNVADGLRNDAANGKFNGKDGAKGDKGGDGTTPQLKIGEDNLWHVSYDNGATWVSLGVKATGAAGKDGADGVTPHIGENGNWWFGDTDTGVSAKGIKGNPGPQGPPGEIPEDYPQIRKDVSQLKDDLSGKIDKPATAPEVGKILKVTAVNDDGTFVCEWADAPSGGGAVDDVQIDGDSIVQDGVANVPVLKDNRNKIGLLKVDSDPYKALYRGLAMQQDLAYGGMWLQIYPASEKFIFDRNGYSNSPIVPKNLDYAVKAAMCDGKGAAWTDAERIAALLRMGLTVDDNGFVKWGASE